MSAHFHERFEIPLGLPEAQRRFVNRVHNDVYAEFFLRRFADSIRHYYVRDIASTLGELYQHNKPITHYAGGDFLRIFVYSKRSMLLSRTLRGGPNWGS
jgi:hypothetical protein